MGTGLSKPSTKRKQQKKSNRLPNKPKSIPKPVVGLKAKIKKAATALGLGKGKGFIKVLTLIVEKLLVLLCEDSKYALEKLLSIITSDNYKDLSNHATKAMRETRLFNIAQVTMSVSFPFHFFHLPCL